MNVSNANTDPNSAGLSLFANTDIDISTPPGTGDIRFNGLIFARDNFRFNAQGQNLIVDGSVVARNGDIEITGANQVDLTYNPEYLELLMENLPDSRTKLETLTWIE